MEVYLNFLVKEKLMKLNIKERYKNSLLYKLINGGVVENQDIDNITTSPDDASTLMALRTNSKELASSIATYKSGVGFVVNPEKTKAPRRTPKTRAKAKTTPVQETAQDKGEDFEQEQ